MRWLRRFIGAVALLVLGVIAFALLHTWVLNAPRVFAAAVERTSPEPTAQFPAAPIGVGAVVTGQVITTGAIPIARAMVTGSDPSGHRRVTVFSDATGAYRLELPFMGDIELRARVSSLADLRQTSTLADGEELVVDFTLTALTAPAELSDQLTASAHAATLEFGPARDRAQRHHCAVLGDGAKRIRSGPIN